MEEYLRNKRLEAPLHFSLIDPEKTGPEEAEKLGEKLASIGTDAFLVGGSLGVSPRRTSEVVTALKKTSLPVIIFPGDIGEIVPEADAILFMSLLNSDDPYFIIGAQIKGAPIVKMYGLEPLPTAYIIVGYGGAAGHVGRARPIPWEQREVAAAYALAASMLGMRFIYLEAGSGSPRPVPPEMVAAVKKAAPEVFLLVGGGIRSSDAALNVVKAGADAIVTGTVIEKGGDVASIVKTIKSFKNAR